MWNEWWMVFYFPFYLRWRIMDFLIAAECAVPHTSTSFSPHTYKNVPVFFRKIARCFQFASFFNFKKSNMLGFLSSDKMKCKESRTFDTSQISRHLLWVRKKIQMTYSLLLLNENLMILPRLFDLQSRKKNKRTIFFWKEEFRTSLSAQIRSGSKEKEFDSIESGDTHVSTYINTYIILYYYIFINYWRERRTLSSFLLFCVGEIENYFKRVHENLWPKDLRKLSNNGKTKSTQKNWNHRILILKHKTDIK